MDFGDMLEKQVTVFIQILITFEILLKIHQNFGLGSDLDFEWRAP